MRTLRFVVNGQKISKDNLCDFSELVAGTEGYLKAEFDFSNEWDGFTKVAAFWGMGKECEPQVLRDGKTCMIPSDALRCPIFEIGIIGKKNGCKIKTGRVQINQERGA